MTTVALLSTSDTDLLSARSAGVDYVVGNPARLTDEQIAERVAGADIVVVRYLGSPQGLWEGFADLRSASAPLVVLGGTQEPVSYTHLRAHETSRVISYAVFCL